MAIKLPREGTKIREALERWVFDHAGEVAFTEFRALLGIRNKIVDPYVGRMLKRYGRKDGPPGSRARWVVDGRIASLIATDPDRPRLMNVEFDWSKVLDDADIKVRESETGGSAPSAIESTGQAPPPWRVGDEGWLDIPHNDVAHGARFRLTEKRTDGLSWRGVYLQWGRRRQHVPPPSPDRDYFFCDESVFRRERP